METQVDTYTHIHKLQTTPSKLECRNYEFLLRNEK